MARVLVNIRGCNGSGKSTIPMSMMDDPLMYVHTIFDSNKKKIGAITVFPSYNWVALGTYFNKTGGMDNIRSTEAKKLTLREALDSFPAYNILMEGVIISTVRQTYVNLFKEIEAYYGKSIKIIVLSLIPPLEICLDHVYQRNGGKPINEPRLQSKWFSIERNVKAFSESGFTSIRVNPSKISREKMLSAFFHTIEKWS